MPVWKQITENNYFSAYFLITQILQFASSILAISSATGDFNKAEGEASEGKQKK